MQDIALNCKDCQNEFTITVEEQKKFFEIQETNPDFKFPKRCKPCRRIKRAQKDALNK